ncbi:hypothetical protein Btru_068116 [Bulinus truncatus]|nr:hypothetical protein Btru_068116 [Bulinus truncatus]
MNMYYYKTPRTTAGVTISILLRTTAGVTLSIRLENHYQVTLSIRLRTTAPLTLSIRLNHCWSDSFTLQSHCWSDSFYTFGEPLDSFYSWRTTAGVTLSILLKNHCWSDSFLLVWRTAAGSDSF